MSKMEKAISEAVVKHLPCIPTFEVRGSDKLDYTKCHVDALKKALEDVYMKGLYDGMAKVVAAQKAGLERGTWSQECLRAGGVHK